MQGTSFFCHLKVTGYDVHLNRDPNRDVKAQLKPGGWKAEESLGLRKVISSCYVSIRGPCSIRYKAAAPVPVQLPRFRLLVAGIFLHTC